MPFRRRSATAETATAMETTASTEAAPTMETAAALKAAAAVEPTSFEATSPEAIL
jgi:hypothetical protein